MEQDLGQPLLEKGKAKQVKSIKRLNTKPIEEKAIAKIIGRLQASQQELLQILGISNKLQVSGNQECLVR